MDKAEILDVLKRNEGELRRRGVRHAALFGSAAKASAAPSSDIDILLDIDATFPMDVFAYAGVVGFVRDLFPAPVDVANRQALKPHLRAEVERDALYAF
ncbi:nucleotidyltransferase family protein [Phreatobacter cathodiphilus]|uniref:Nucleotidyltransferase n=1 Tax=Phreatobacter cathodiphilus TaxID=1868589 RepID=A0A2S0NFW6_9HYPH|nr:nucleotidyltransferase domain-containing protein [Phreatobacter cathodiphilus]AVO46831.1 nucleotidyltransferase [Phreatobacter cathodiphilus]